MHSPRSVSGALLILSLSIALAGCTYAPSTHKPPRQGPKVNLLDLMHNTSAYKGKTMQFVLTVDEPPGRTVREYVGRDLHLTAEAPGKERLHLTVTIPRGLAVPEVAAGAKVNVRFVCTRGEMQAGNVVRWMDLP
jgi:hypothetical protein